MKGKKRKRKKKKEEGEEEERRGKRKRGRRRRKGRRFFVEKNPARVLLTPRIPLREIFLPKKKKRMLGK